LQGVSHAVRYQPILFGSLLQHHGTIGPAELAPKRAWTYRHVSWLAQAQGTPMQMPVSHPFNPLPLLRLALACGGERAPNRWVCETIFRHVWAEGGDPLDADRLARLVDVLKPAVDPASEAVKLQLRSATESALAAGVFGVPTVAVGDKLFWGLDALPMLRDHLDGGVWFSGSAWDDAAQVPVGLVRRR
jgi:2-hydroxychromene-2-carboxylate isomerase